VSTNRAAGPGHDLLRPPRIGSQPDDEALLMESGTLDSPRWAADCGIAAPPPPVDRLAQLGRGLGEDAGIAPHCRVGAHGFSSG
jgi:hypothetical protein